MLLAMIIFATASMWEALGERGWAVGICGALLLLSLVAFKRSEIKAFQSEPVVFTLAGIVLALAILFWILRRDEV